VTSRGEKVGWGPAPPGICEVNKQYLPDKYIVNSRLEITIPSGSGKITKDFELND
jgi:hypothetical protein